MEKRRQRAERCSKIKKSGKRGFTLVELSVVLLLLSILTGMIISFTLLVRKNNAQMNEELAFATDADAVRTAVVSAVSRLDREGTVFSVTEAGALLLGDEVLTFSEGVLMLGADTLAEAKSLDGIAFATNGGIIKGILWRERENGEKETVTFAIAPVCGSIEEVAG